MYIPIEFSLPIFNPTILTPKLIIMTPILAGMFLLEHRAYNEEDSTAQLIEALKSRVSLLDENIIQWVELPIMTEFTVTNMFDKLDELLNENDVKAIYFDLSQSGIPSVTVRKILYQRFENVSNQVKVYGFFTGKNSLINIAIKFFLNSRKTNLANFECSITKEKALAYIYEKLGR